MTESNKRAGSDVGEERQETKRIKTPKETKADHYGEDGDWA